MNEIPREAFWIMDWGWSCPVCDQGQSCGQPVPDEIVCEYCHEKFKVGE